MANIEKNEHGMRRFRVEVEGLTVEVLGNVENARRPQTATDTKTLLTVTGQRGRLVYAGTLTYEDARDLGYALLEVSSDIDAAARRGRRLAPD